MAYQKVEVADECDTCGSIGVGYQYSEHDGCGYLRTMFHTCHKCMRGENAAIQKQGRPQQVGATGHR